ncbi:MULTISPECIES: DUF4190 domain-containing protein [Alteribacter]|uniref:DUF4190 domain-containing protein n=1 Tax=Alteribacter keqinensis TaxID=2483800 RepID=A0A3M7TQF4_9BACI|nr:MULTISPECIES: DUF4190 domain-containing protein [Alteribacter]MBM7096924.1 DUF4190 domain-containing protein [Alteribacter salitolerans]RNA67497.1 DUF4190 domain-containing protein [Alteribacter keqinensis]
MERRTASIYPNKPVHDDGLKRAFAYSSFILGIASLIGGILLAFMSIPSSLLAIILAIPGRKSTERRSFATAGMILGIISLLFMLLYFLIFFSTIFDLEDKIIEQVRGW